MVAPQRRAGEVFVGGGLLNWRGSGKHLAGPVNFMHNLQLANVAENGSCHGPTAVDPVGSGRAGITSGESIQRSDQIRLAKTSRTDVVTGVTTGAPSQAPRELRRG